MPGIIEFWSKDVILDTKITKNYKIRTLFISSLWIQWQNLIWQGGIRFVHCNCYIEKQVAEVEKVKWFTNCFIIDHKTVKKL